METRSTRAGAQLVTALLVTAGLCLSSPTTAAQAAPLVKTLDFRMTLAPVSAVDHALPGDVSYGQSRLAGATVWGGRRATVQWLCSHVASGGEGPTYDLVTITRSDGAVLALSISGWASADHLRGTVEVIGGNGAYRGASGTGTVVGSPGKARMRLTVSQSRNASPAPRQGVGC